MQSYRGFALVCSILQSHRTIVREMKIRCALMIVPLTERMHENGN